jgi:hypothetical protein
VASASDHLALANRNQEALDFLLTRYDRFPEWITSIAFYKALHVVDALLDHDGAPTPSDHSSRRQILQRANRYKTLFLHYDALCIASSVARYLASVKGKQYRSFVDYLTPDRVLTEMLNHRLHSVEESAVKLMGEAGRALARMPPQRPTPPKQSRATS